jgi:hypothetical protein
MPFLLLQYTTAPRLWGGQDEALLVMDPTPDRYLELGNS